jgi:hypothetical protein
VLSEKPIAVGLHGATWGTAETGDCNCRMSS